MATKKTTKTAVRSTVAKAAKRASAADTADTREATPRPPSLVRPANLEGRDGPTLAQRNARTADEVAAANAPGAAPVATSPPRPASAPAPSGQDLGQTLADHSLETHQAAAGLAQLQVAGSDAVAAATDERVAAINRAVEERNAEAKQLQEQEQADAEQAEAERVENAAVPLDSAGAEENALRVPMGVAKPASAVQPQGIHPDVTSPVTGPVVQVPGTGVAKLSELAPGQSLAPSPPISSSNILPQPDKPSFG